MTLPKTFGKLNDILSWYCY